MKSYIGLYLLPLHFSRQNPLLHRISLRPRVHNLQLPYHPNHLAESNFIVRMLFRNVLLTFSFTLSVSLNITLNFYRAMLRRARLCDSKSSVRLSVCL